MNTKNITTTVAELKLAHANLTQGLFPSISKASLTGPALELEDAMLAALRTLELLRKNSTELVGKLQRLGVNPPENADFSAASAWLRATAAPASLDAEQTAEFAELRLRLLTLWGEIDAHLASEVTLEFKPLSRPQLLKQDNMPPGPLSALREFIVNEG